LINQTLKDIEIICINDGSTDNSLDILTEYAKIDERIIVINKSNEGQSVARNLGIEYAKGEFLGFVDSDDWIDLDYFEKLYNAAKKYKADMACAGYKRCRKNRKSIKKSYEAELICTTANDKVRLDNLPADNYIWNKIYHREAWNEANIKFEANRYFEDMAIIIKILHKLDKMVTVPDIYYNYRVNPNSTVAQKTQKRANDLAWAQNELVRYAEENNIKIDKSNVLLKRAYFKIFNLTWLKAYYYESLVIYKLFGILPVGKKVIL
jgi:glycosyltransferase involved in cell wall biosynthesis